MTPPQSGCLSHALATRDPAIVHDLDSIRLSFATPDEIRSWSSGEITRSATFDENGDPVEGGLFCEKIFGAMNRRRAYGPSINDWGWETQLQDGMGHIELECPLIHPWLYATKVSPLSVLLGMQPGQLRSLVHYRMHLVIDAGQTHQQLGQLLTQHQYDQTRQRLDFDSFKTLSGAVAVRHLLEQLDWDDLADQLHRQLATTTRRRKISSIRARLGLLDAFREQQIGLEHLILDVLPVVSPQLRPGAPPYPDYFPHPDAPPHHLNAGYQQILEANAEVRLASRILRIAQKRGTHLFRATPDEIRTFEKSVLRSCQELQQTVDHLLRGSQAETLNSSSKEPLACRLRRDIRGLPSPDAPVVPSACAVVVPGPRIAMNECGLPKNLALALYEPLVIQRLIEAGIARPLSLSRLSWQQELMVHRGQMECKHAQTLNHARLLVAWQGDVVWDILDAVMRDHWVLLGRTDLQSREQVQAFKPRLIEGHAIQIHPLIGRVFGIEFHGEQLKVFLPSSDEAQSEARTLLAPENNLFDGRAGEPAIKLDKQLLVGLAYLTQAQSDRRGHGMTFSSTNEVITAWQNDRVDLHAQVKVRLPTGKGYRNEGDLHQGQRATPADNLIQTTVGRVLANEMMPPEMDFLNCQVDHGTLSRIVEDGWRLIGRRHTISLLGEIAKLAGEHLLRSGLSIGIQDLVTPTSKPKHISEAEKQITKSEKLHHRGLITQQEKYNNQLDVWTHAREQIHSDLMQELKSGIGFQPVNSPASQQRPEAYPTSRSVSLLSLMGAFTRAVSHVHLRNLCSMIGLLARPDDSISPIPVKSNFREGLRCFEYWRQSFAVRHGWWFEHDRRVAANQLRRKLMRSAGDVIITTRDCGTRKSLSKTAVVEDFRQLESLARQIVGRVSAESVVLPVTDEVVVAANQLITPAIATRIEDLRIQHIDVRSPTTCEAVTGICAHCYGVDPGTQALVEVGTAVGVRAAMAFSEALRHPDWCRLRVFRFGPDPISVPKDYPEFEEDRRSLENRARWGELVEVRAQRDGTIDFERLKLAGDVILNDDGAVQILDHRQRVVERYRVPRGTVLAVQQGQRVLPQQQLAHFEAFVEKLIAKRAGTATLRFDGPAPVTTQRADNPIRITDGDLPRKPRIEIQDNRDQIIEVHYLGVGFEVTIDQSISSGSQVQPGSLLAKGYRDSAVPHAVRPTERRRLNDLLLLRRPVNTMKLAPIDAEVVAVERCRSGVHHIHLRGSNHLQKVSARTYPSVRVGDVIHRGDPLTGGVPHPGDLFRYRGPHEAIRYLRREIKQLFLPYRVELADQHIELIIAQMLRRVRITEPGDSGLSAYQVVDREELYRINCQLMGASHRDSSRPAIGQTLLTSIAKAGSSRPVLGGIQSPGHDIANALVQAVIEGRADALANLQTSRLRDRHAPISTGHPSTQPEQIDME